MTSPTTSEYLNAANWTYLKPATLPAGLTQLTLDGAPVAQQVTQDGFYATAFLTPANQVLVTFEGTSPDSLLSNFPFGVGQLAADSDIYLGKNPPAYADALAFTRQVLSEIGAVGIPASNVFLAGHSLGGAEAEYVSAQLGLPGETFGAPGIPNSDVNVTGANLLDYVDYGDPVGNYAVDSGALGDFLYSSTITHYGQMDLVGNPFSVAPLLIAAGLFGLDSSSTAVALTLIGINAALYHLPTNYADDLGVALTNAAPQGPGGLALGTLGLGSPLSGGTANGGVPELIAPGPGSTTIAPGSGNHLIVSTGQDTLLPATGADTVIATGHMLAFVGSGHLTFYNGNNASIVAADGPGSAAIWGGVGGGLFEGGSGGNNLIVAGSGAATLFGGSGADQLFAGGAVADVLVAGSGNETLSGGGSVGDNMMFAGSGNDLLRGGAGREIFFAGHGNATVIGGTGADLYAFGKGSAGGTETIIGFNPAKGDRVTLQGYGAGEAQARTTGGNTVLTLSDHTTISFLGVADLGPSLFV